MDKRNDTEIFCEAVETVVNNTLFKPKDIVNKLTNMHRTLKQSFTSFCFMWIIQQAKEYDEGNYDGRNEDSGKKCSEIVKAVELYDGSCAFI